MFKASKMKGSWFIGVSIRREITTWRPNNNCNYDECYCFSVWKALHWLRIFCYIFRRHTPRSISLRWPRSGALAEFPAKFKVTLESSLSVRLSLIAPSLASMRYRRHQKRVIYSRVNKLDVDESFIFKICSFDQPFDNENKFYNLFPSVSGCQRNGLNHEIHWQYASLYG